MMPTFFLLEEEEVNNHPILAELEPRQLPKISIDDPAVLSIRQEFNMSAEDITGRVIKFLRRSLNAGTSNYYRIVVDTPIGAKTWSALI